MSSLLSIYDTDSWWPIIVTTVFTIIFGIRLYVRGPECPTTATMDGKTVLITGGSGGMGLETAKELVARGAHVILTCRNKEKGNQAIESIKKWHPHGKVELRILDVSILQSIKRFVNTLEKEFTKIDVLINNAGVIFHPYQETLEGHEITTATNYLGPFALSHLLLPLLSKSENGRIINITALAHFSAKIDINRLSISKQFDNTFGQTKLALLLFSRHFAKLLKSANITVNAVNPGLVRDTDHLRHSHLQSSSFTKFSVWPWMWLFMKTPKQGAQTIIYAAVEPTLSTATGGYYSNCAWQEPSSTAKDEKLAQQVYEITCTITGIDGVGIIGQISKSA